ncbi:30 kDa heat shock protein [Cyphellophora attinorum]|uniref:30 kDa heat shock protein n=1 Tax=Cyphellophora attinorum TaxID=1664694 RepID=A0A0N1HBY1_9EURO|nr:30 kDa heat shock protein [Phialophora attinorum]KPI45822.1 30 kDa heat shock protein [Phialophora attinorum]
MSLLFPRFAYAPVAHCAPARREVAPLWSLFDDTLNELQRATRQSTRQQRQWNPRFDVQETKEGYTLEGELPGVDQSNINIEFTDEHTIKIKGRTESVTEKGKQPEQAVEATQDGTATPASEEGSVKSHQATVEDDAEEPANSSAAAEQAVAEKTPEPVKETKKSNDQQFWYRERSVGEFTRSFRFNARVDQDAVRASLKNGILSIVVPKAAVPESRRINIE